MSAPKDLHPLVIALVEHWARGSGYEPADVWSWLRRDSAPPAAFVAGAVEAFYPLVRADDFRPLPYGAHHTKIRDSMQAETLQTGGVGRPPTAHAFTRALADKGMTVTEWADSHRDPKTGKPLDRQYVKGWYISGSGARRIPEKWAKVIARELGVPATAASWPNGIRAPRKHGH